MKVGDSSVTTLDTASPQISVLVGGLIDGENLGIPWQGGDSRFLQRFALQTHAAYDQAAAMRFAAAHQNPLVAALTGKYPRYPEMTYSLLKISDPRVLLWSLKPADDGMESAGMALRVWNLSNARAEFTAISETLRITAAQHATHIETPMENAQIVNGGFAAKAAAHALETFLLVPAR